MLRSVVGFALMLILIAATGPVSAQKTLGEVNRLNPEFDRLIPADAEIEILAKGFTWTEGPLWIGGEDGYLLFSDIPRNSVYRWSPQDGTSLFLRPSGYTGHDYYGLEPGSNGLILDPSGRIVFCEHGDRRVSVMTKGGGKMTLADSYEGKRLNSPNDGCFHKNGDLYFTDPPYGLPNRENDPRREQPHFGVYRLKARQVAEHKGRLTWEREPELLTAEMTRPNGIAFSPDFKTLYVAQSDPEAAIWKAFPVQEDGRLGHSKLLFDATENVGRLPGLPDGLKADQRGNLFATGPGGVYLFSPKGELLGRLETGERTANVGWGNDGSTLYICADSYLCRIKTSTKGAGW